RQCAKWRELLIEQHYLKIFLDFFDFKFINDALQSDKKHVTSLDMLTRRIDRQAGGGVAYGRRGLPYAVGEISGRCDGQSIMLRTGDSVVVGIRPIPPRHDDADVDEKEHGGEKVEGRRDRPSLDDEGDLTAGKAGAAREDTVSDRLNTESDVVESGRVPRLHAAKDYKGDDAEDGRTDLLDDHRRVDGDMNAGEAERAQSEHERDYHNRHLAVDVLSLALEVQPITPSIRVHRENRVLTWAYFP
ncbi:hypothetical protein PENTCL1PPCAC_3779, partial [Pristionchus entomophagus]